MEKKKRKKKKRMECQCRCIKGGGVRVCERRRKGRREKVRKREGKRWGRSSNTFCRRECVGECGRVSE